MLVRTPNDEGFGLVEVIIAFFLLAVISVAILPALYSGISDSARQATTASATRELNALIETARQQAANGSCAGVATASAVHRYSAGADVGATASNYDFQTSGPAGFACSTGAENTLTLRAVSRSGIGLVTVTATIFVTS